MDLGTRVRSRNDGQLGWVAEHEGRKMVRLDRRGAIYVPFNEQQWKPDTELGLEPMQVARVQYEADRALQTVMGKYGLPEWIALKREADRQVWMNEPEGASAERLALYRAIGKALGTK